MTFSRRDFVVSLTGALALPAADSRFVRADGPHLLMPDGRKLILRGINLGNWLEPEGYMFLFDGGPQSPREIEAFFNELIGPVEAEKFWRDYRRQYITKADIQFIKNCGLNSVRIPFHYKDFVKGETEGFRLLDAAVDWCREAGIWVVLDMHCAPGGQTGTNIDDSWGYPWLYESKEAQDLACEVWRRIAQHYREEPVVIGYDLLNEPIPHFPSLHKYNDALEPLFKRITQAIREVDKEHLIFLEGAQWDSNFAVFGAPFDSKLVYQFHKYWTAPTQEVIHDYVAYRDRYHVPIWLGESGENSDEWIQQFTAVLEKNEIGWCYWPYKKMEKTSCLVSIAKPVHWDEITAFAKLPVGTGGAEKRMASRPSLEHSREAMKDLLHKIQFSQCPINSGYLRALGMHS